MKIYNDRPGMRESGWNTGRGWLNWNQIIFILFISVFFVIPLLPRTLNSGIKLLTDNDNPRIVKIRADQLKIRTLERSYSPINEVPTGDFQIVSVTEDDLPFVAEVRDSSASWGGLQRAERYIALQTALEKAKACNLIQLKVSGQNFSYPLIGKSYPVMLEARSNCS